MNRTLSAAAFVLLAGASASAQTPTVDQILDKYVAAIGGRAAFDKLTNRVRALRVSTVRSAGR